MSLPAVVQHLQVLEASGDGSCRSARRRSAGWTGWATHTEQAAFVDGHDVPAQRQHRMGSLLDSLGRSLGA